MYGIVLLKEIQKDSRFAHIYRNVVVQALTKAEYPLKVAFHHFRINIVFHFCNICYGKYALPKNKANMSLASKVQ